VDLQPDNSFVFQGLVLSNSLWEGIFRSRRLQPAPKKSLISGHGKPCSYKEWRIFRSSPQGTDCGSLADPANNESKKGSSGLSVLFDKRVDMGSPKDDLQ
jgi:hypothetical protein